MTFSLSDDVDVVKWQKHIREGYIKSALTGDFADFKIMKLVRTPHGDPGKTLALKLVTSSHHVIERFENEFKPKLDHQLYMSFGESCLTFVTVLEHL